nr:Peptidase M12A domain containing protein [Haemonchus contortus]
MRLFKRDKVQAIGDTVTEINANTKVDKDPFKTSSIQEYTLSVNDMVKRVNYYFDKTASPKVQSVFVKAAKLWEKDTCINFTKDSSAEDTIKVFAGDGCFSWVGRLGGEQNVSLGYGCETVGTAAHEIGHALGFFHTMSRYDRDEFITVNAENIESPNNTVIEVKLLGYSSGVSIDGCPYAGVEIKTNKDQTLTGYSSGEPLIEDSDKHEEGEEEEEEHEEGENVKEGEEEEEGEEYEEYEYGEYEEDEQVRPCVDYHRE